MSFALSGRMLSSCHFSPPKTYILKIGNYPSPPQFNCFVLRFPILLGSPPQTADDSWTKRKKDMLFQLNQTRVTFKVGKNQLSPPSSHTFPLWVQQCRYNAALIKSAGQPKTWKAFCVRRHSDPSSKMPCSFFTWQVFFSLCMLNSWGLLIVHRAALTPWSKKGTDVKVKYIRPCASTQCLGPAGNMALQVKGVESFYKHPRRRETFGNSQMSESSNRELLCQNYCLSFMFY